MSLRICLVGNIDGDRITHYSGSERCKLLVRPAASWCLGCRTRLRHGDVVFIIPNEVELNNNMEQQTGTTNPEQQPGKQPACALRSVYRLARRRAVGWSRFTRRPKRFAGTNILSYYRHQLTNVGTDMIRDNFSFAMQALKLYYDTDESKESGNAFRE